MNKKVKLEIVALSHSITQSHNYAVVLGEIDGNRRLPIVIGGYEAQSIAVAMEHMEPSRPLTHDLLKNILVSLEAQLLEIVISNLSDGVFFAELICKKDEKVISIDSRTSDALALAVRFNCPIYAHEFILEEAGILLDSSTEGENIEEPFEEIEEASGFQKYTIQELEGMIQDVLEEEDYEKAAEIRDEINKRNNK